MIFEHSERGILNVDYNSVQLVVSLISMFQTGAILTDKGHCRRPEGYLHANLVWILVGSQLGYKG